MQRHFQKTKLQRSNDDSSHPAVALLIGCNLSLFMITSYFLPTMNPLKTVFLGLSAAGLLFFGLSFGIDSLEPYTWYFGLAALAATTAATVTTGANTRLR